MRTSIIFLLSLFCFNSLCADVIISEFLASNGSVIQDEDQEYSDYLELWNNGEETVALGGYHLTDSRNELTQWRLPQVSIAPDERLLIFADNKDRAHPSGELHTNFAISRDGEYLALVAPDGVTVVDEYSPRFPEQTVDVAYGVWDGGNGMTTFLVPSPGEANQERYGVGAPPVFSVAHGFKETPFTLHIETTTTDADIYYTLDGSIPDAAEGMLYDSEDGIEIDDTRIVRAVAILEGYAPSPVSTASYIFLDSVVNQSNDQSHRGFPDQWVIERNDYNRSRKIRDGDYELDPEIPIEPSDLNTIPSVSLVLPNEDLWDGMTGIYVNSHKDAGEDPFWERVGSIEYFDPDSDVTFTAPGGVRLFGQAATNQEINDKMGFRVVFRGEYGDGRLETDMFDRVGPGDDDINTIVLRSHFGRSFLRDPNYSNWRGTLYPWECLYMRDVFSNETYRATGQLNPRTMMVHLYLNGLYFGLYEAVERPDDSFNAENRGGDDEDYDVIKGDSRFREQNGMLHSGQFDTYQKLMSYFDTNEDGENIDIGEPHAITDQELAEIRQYLDLEAFCDYMISLWVINRSDFPDKNWYASAKRGAPGEPPEEPFLFYVWDSESVLFFPESFNRKTPSNVRTAAENWNEPDEPYDTGPVRLYRRLKLNETFRRLWADRVYELMFNDGPLNTENNLARWDKLATELDRAIIGESARWGDWSPNYRDNPITRDDWLDEVELVRNEVIAPRNAQVISQMREYNIYPDLNPPQINQNGDVIMPNEQVELSHDNGAGTMYYTLDGSDPRDNGIPYGNPLDLEQPTILRMAVNQGNEWSAAAARTLIPFGGLPLAITEIMYSPGQTEGVAIGEENELEFLEITNVGENTISLQQVEFTDGVTFDFGSGAISELEPGKSVLIVRNETMFREVYGDDLPVAGEYDGNLNDGGERIELSVAGYQIQGYIYDDEGDWPSSANGNGESLSLAAAELDPGMSDSWLRSGVRGGTPGTWEAAVSVSDPWGAVSSRHGARLRHHPVFGTYTLSLDSIILHQEHGWLSIQGDANGGWWYDYVIGWIYTNEPFYSYFYSFKRQNWLYYYPGTTGPRWFYDYQSQSWMVDSQLEGVDS